MVSCDGIGAGFGTGDEFPIGRMGATIVSGKLGNNTSDLITVPEGNIGNICIHNIFTCEFIRLRTPTDEPCGLLRVLGASVLQCQRVPVSGTLSCLSWSPRWLRMHHLQAPEC
ncbi:hypothetical protein ATCV1_z338R [Acanthocystis turfacea chlorella virus 1]|uniref:Uncharacterized protein z338R n=1 Tax=Chlorovirus heliozoae TaxID=322019 RepID=A7K8U8_9PHYC|nr:hypothetical protein ATCV1_z338R [Acanthocystis turfacea chlorella virus 1]ABT16472.1 hypothetical protein ATCV1_z338R [Acanthocystis turfacea chlorella virus 1]